MGSTVRSRPFAAACAGATAGAAAAGGMTGVTFGTATRSVPAVGAGGPPHPTEAAMAGMRLRRIRADLVVEFFMCLLVLVGRRFDRNVVSRPIAAESRRRTSWSSIHPDAREPAFDGAIFCVTRIRALRLGREEGPAKRE